MKKQSTKILLYFFIPLLFFSKVTNNETVSAKEQKTNVQNKMPYELERLIYMEKIRNGKIRLLQNNLESSIHDIKISQSQINTDGKDKR